MTDQTHHQVGTHDKSVEWYNEQLENVSEATRELLEKYSKIPADRIISHCLKVVRQYGDAITSMGCCI